MSALVLWFVAKSGVTSACLQSKDLVLDNSPWGDSQQRCSYQLLHKESQTLRQFSVLLLSPATIDRRTSQRPRALGIHNRFGIAYLTAESPEDLNALTIPFLKEKLRSQGLKVSGKKAELIARLSQNSDGKDLSSGTSEKTSDYRPERVLSGESTHASRSEDHVKHRQANERLNRIDGNENGVKRSFPGAREARSRPFGSASIGRPRDGDRRNNQHVRSDRSRTDNYVRDGRKVSSSRTRSRTLVNTRLDSSRHARGAASGYEDDDLSSEAEDVQDLAYIKKVTSAFSVGQKVKVKVVDLGFLGASCETVDAVVDATGLILESQIEWFEDVNQRILAIGDVVSAFVQKVRQEDGKLNLGFKEIGKSRIEVVIDLVMDELEISPSSSIPIGDKSSPKSIGAVIPGISKSEFKKAVGVLYKRKWVIPGPTETRLSD